MDSMANGCAYIGGQFMPIANAAIPITDWGFLRGDCVYDAIPFSAGRLFRLEDHLDRLHESERRWRLKCPLDRKDLRSVAHECVGRSQLRHGLLMLITTRGVPPSLEIRNPALFQNRFYAFAQVLPSLKATSGSAGGMNLLVSKVPRIPQESVDSIAKNFQWGDFTQARLEAHDENVDNALLLDTTGNLTEGPGFNVFVLKGNDLLTPKDHCLRGITRDTVMDIATELGLRVQEKGVGLEALSSADEVFLSTSAGGVMLVDEVRGVWSRPKGESPVYQMIFDAYWARRMDPKYSESIDYGAYS